MNQTKLKWVALAAVAAAVLTLGACKKKVAPPPPPPPPPAVAPTASLTATPSTIERGQSTTLAWQTSNANEVSIEGIGAVEASGSRTEAPAQSTAYRLTAKGPGGTENAVARVTVTEPPPPPPTPQPSPTDAELFHQNVKNIFFDFDQHNIRADQQEAMQANAQFLAQHPQIKFTIEGHCDERGSIEYNLALGDSRANSAKQALMAAGVNADRIHTVSYGKERPACTEQNEECWQQNRRAHFVHEQ
jgi:peptidoglycan-associated lipoprotein